MTTAAAAHPTTRTTRVNAGPPPHDDDNDDDTSTTTRTRTRTTATEYSDKLQGMLHRAGGPREKPLVDPDDHLEAGHGTLLGLANVNGHDHDSVKDRLLSFHVDDSQVNGALVGGAAAHKGSAAAPHPPFHNDDDTTSSLTSTLSPRDKRALALLVALYLLQGIPVGLAFGSIPFLLRAKLSYSQIGIFTLCTYPYSLKLLWSPIVDSVFSPKLGRRKSWIVPIQTVVGILFWWLGSHVQQMMEVDEPNVQVLTGLFFTLVFFAATQDIAVDGWALTLLSKENLSYASTAQTVGLNTGYFLSFTVFLAFNSVEFSNKYFRSTPLEYPLISLSGYLHFWSIAFLAVTAYLAFFQPEDPTTAVDQDEMDLKKVYSIMRDICRLKHVQSFMLVHLVTKLGTAANDAATSLKLLEKGLKKEDLALAVLIDFPFQILFGYLAAKWSKGEKPLKPWLIAMWTRLAWAAVSMLLIRNFPSGDIGTWYFMLVVACTVGSSFSSTVQFVGISAFHTQIADPLIGGTYMTLLNTVSNLGGTWPKFFVLKGIDAFSVAVCRVKDENLDLVVASRECVSDHGKAACAELGGTCLTERDGYFYVSTLCILSGAAILVLFVQPVARRLQVLPLEAWRVKKAERI